MWSMLQLAVATSYDCIISYSAQLESCSQPTSRSGTLHDIDLDDMICQHRHHLGHTGKAQSRHSFAAHQCSRSGARARKIQIPAATSAEAYSKDVTGLSSLRFAKPEDPEMARLMSDWTRYLVLTQQEALGGCALLIVVCVVCSMACLA